MTGLLARHWNIVGSKVTPTTYILHILPNHNQVLPNWSIHLYNVLWDAETELRDISCLCFGGKGKPGQNLYIRPHGYPRISSPPHPLGRMIWMISVDEMRGWTHPIHTSSVGYPDGRIYRFRPRELITPKQEANKLWNWKQYTRWRQHQQQPALAA